MLQIALTTILVITGSALVAQETQKEEQTHTVKLILTGAKEAEKEEPLGGVQVSLRTWDGATYHTFKVGKTDADGLLTMKIASGRYKLKLDSPKEWPYIPRAIKFPSTGRFEYGHELCFDVVERTEPQTFAFTLRRGDELILRAIDEETGKGLPGVMFAGERAGAEIWMAPINGHNVGFKPVLKWLEWKDEKCTASRTDKKGELRRYIHPDKHYLYWVYETPKNYKLIGPQDFEPKRPPIGAIDKPIKAEQTFKFRRVEKK